MKINNKTVEDILNEIRCDERLETKDGFPYCRSNKLDCPYLERFRLVDLGIQGSFHPCSYQGFYRKDIKEVKK